MKQLQAGDKAPDFSLTDQNGKTVNLSEFRGKRLLVYFYPKADTSGCTKQACNVRDASPDFAELNVAAIGISPDKPDKQKKFDDKFQLGFPLLSDPDNVVAKNYGAWGEKRMYGKTYEGIIRSAFLIDEDGKIVQAWYKVSPGDTAPNILKALSN
ncbi:MAG: thioredoxin-dependent thiol peroxidase [Deltaproteobacteria bacterium]|nr:thioredoxin-dependent thiol peroxidase [Deltaproteobacteria bacterium]